MPKNECGLSAFEFFAATATPLKMLDFALEYGLLTRPVMCPKCEGSNFAAAETIQVKADGVFWRCRSCKYDWTVRSGSIFLGSQLPLRKIFAILRGWCMGLLADQIAEDVGDVNIGTIHNWIKVFQQVVFDDYPRTQVSGTITVLGEIPDDDDRTLLGGEAIVAADEMRVGRHKKGFFGHKTRPLADVVGAVEMVPGGRLILDVIPKLANGKFRQKGPPSANELRTWAKTFIKDGSTVFTDGATAYTVLARENNWHHEVVSHKRGQFAKTVRPKKGTYKGKNLRVHTNQIDGLWSHLRGFINARFGIRKHRLAFYLREFEWRYNTHEPLFRAFGRLLSQKLRAPPNRRSLNVHPLVRTPDPPSTTAPRKRNSSNAPKPKAKRRLL